MARRWCERLRRAWRERYGSGVLGALLAFLNDGPMPRAPAPLGQRIAAILFVLVVVAIIASVSFILLLAGASGA